MRLLYIGTGGLQEELPGAFSHTRGDYDVVNASTKDAFTSLLEQKESGVILYDYCASPESLPLSQALIYARVYKMPVIVLTSTNVETPVDDLLSAGISGYAFREHLSQLPFVISSMADAAQLERETQEIYQALERTGHYYQTLLKNINDFVFLFNDNGDLVYLSPSAHQLTGFSSLEDQQLFEYIHPDDRRQFFVQFKKILKKPEARVDVHFRIRHKAGHYIWIEGGVTNLVKNDAIEAFVLSCRDDTQRTEMEQTLMRLNQLNTSIRQVNRAILSVDNERALFKEICGIATQHGHFKMAYISVMDNTTGKLRLIQSSGVAERDVEPSMVVSSLESAPFNYVLQTGQSYVCNNVQNEMDGEYWKYVARQKGFRSFIILPITRRGKVAGVFVLAATQPDFFFRQETELLEETASDISFKVDILRKDRLPLPQEPLLRQQRHVA